MDGLNTEPEPGPEGPKPAEDAKSAPKQRKPRKKPEKPALPHAAANVQTAPIAVDAKFFGSLGTTLRDLKREKNAEKFSNFVVA